MLVRGCVLAGIVAVVTASDAHDAHDDGHEHLSMDALDDNLVTTGVILTGTASRAAVCRLMVPLFRTRARTGLIVMSLLFELGTEWLEHRLHDYPHVQKMVGCD